MAALVTLTQPELERRLVAADPSVVLAPAPVLRRVIRHDRGFLGLPLKVPHHKTYIVSSRTLLEVTSREELGIDPIRGLPERVIVLVAPTQEELETTGAPTVLLEYWRLLFHARVHVALEDRWARGELTLQHIQQWVARIGEAKVREALAVLDSEHLLLPPDDHKNGFVEFAAVFLELAYFADTLLPSYFPSLDAARVRESLERETSARELYGRTRPDGAPDPSPPTETASEEPLAFFRSLTKDADEASRSGNWVRAAILRTRAARVAPAAEEEPTRAKARASLDALVDRLTGVLRAGDAATAPEDAARWRATLEELLDKSDQGLWPQEARLLHDLQRACFYGERDVFKVSALRWLLGGRLKEPLPDQRDLQICKYLARAMARLPAVRLSVDARRDLQDLLRGAHRSVERRLRKRLRPIVESAFVESGLAPSNVPEEIVLSKLLDELLDRITERWFFTFSDVRDALAANPLKLADVAGPSAVISGDLLIGIDRRLATALVGIYRPGESYRRGLHRAGSTLSATRPGRALVRYALLPLGGAWGLELLGQHFAHLARRAPEAAPAAPLAAKHPAMEVAAPAGASVVTDLGSWIHVAVLGVALALLINHPRVRHGAKQFLYYLSLALRAVLVELPLAITRVRGMRRLLENDIVLAFVRYVLRPAGLAAVFAFFFWWVDRTPPLVDLALLFLCSALVLNSRPWRNVEEGLEDSVLRSWRFLWFEAVPGFFRWVMRFFRQLSESLEALAYGVDEWLRYRSGEGRSTLALKATLAPLWAPIDWTLRFAFDVFLEPRINPIKYVSVVMIVDKISYIMTPTLLAFFTAQFAGLGKFGANVFAWIMLWSVPAGVGFLIWELKENWRLYRANASGALEPQLLHLHGETLPRLLKLGGRGSKLSAIYGRLRRAERQAHRTGSWQDSRRQRALLEEVRRAVRHFTQRSLLRILEKTPSWGAIPVAVPDVRLGLNQLSIDLASETFADRTATIVLELEGGWLVAHVAEAGWLADVAPRQADAFRAALFGFYVMSGVDLVREQVAAYLGSFPGLALTFEVAEEGLKVWPRDHFEAAAIYDLHEDGTMRPEPIFAHTPLSLPVLEAERVRFNEKGASWEEWVRIWREAEEGRGAPLSREVPIGRAVAPVVGVVERVEAL